MQTGSVDDNPSHPQEPFETGGPREAFVLPIDGSLDLHAFHPSDVASVVSEYLRECRRLGLQEARFIHGRGKGVQRGIVHAILKETPFVVAFFDAPPGMGGWGVTVALLRTAEENRQDSAHPR